MSSAKARSAVVSFRTSGALVARTPRSVHAARSMLSYPAAMLHAAARRGLASRSAASTRSRPVMSAPSLSARRARSSSGENGVSAWLSSTSKRSRRYASTSGKFSRVTRTRGRMARRTYHAPSAPLDRPGQLRRVGGGPSRAWGDRLIGFSGAAYAIEPGSALGTVHRDAGWIARADPAGRLLPRGGCGSHRRTGRPGVSLQQREWRRADGLCGAASARKICARIGPPASVSRAAA